MGRYVVLILSILVCACDTSSPRARSDNTAPVIPPAPVKSPCLNAGCATKTEHLSIFDAENSVFSADGRLFISGGEAVYEITKDGGGNLVSTVISNQACNFTGVTIKATTLYAACGDNRLFAADINNFPLTPIYSISGSQLANGLAELEGRLYITDGPLSPTSKIIQLHIDPTNDLAITSQNDWTIFGELTSANGLQIVNGELWVTDYNQLKRFVVNGDGSKGASSTVLTSGVGAYDDFTVLDNDQIVMNDFTGNTSQLFSPAGVLLESTSNVVGPSSAIQGQGPMFDASQIIITEKGVLSDRTAGNGNRIAVFTPN